MKGFILTSALALIDRYMDPEVVEKLNNQLQLESSGVYESNSDYCDKEFTRLFDTLAEISGMKPDKMYKAIGFFIFAESRAAAPEWVETADSAYSALIQHDVIVLASLEKAFPGYIGSVYECKRETNNSLSIDFHSPYLPPRVAEGFILATCLHFDEAISIELLPAEKKIEETEFSQRFLLKRKAAVSRLA